MLTMLLTLLAAPQETPHDYWGTIAIVDGDRRRAPASGWIEFCITSGLDQRVVVDQGRWHLDTGAQDVMYVGNVVLEGRKARCLPEPERWKRRGEVALEASHPARTLLHVTDAETRVPLADVGVWEDWYYEAQKHSVAIDTYEWAKGSSPLDITFPLAACESMSIPHGWGALELWATAPGYEWGRAIADLTSGGEYAIEVRRLGTLKVYLAPELGNAVQVEMRDQRGRRETRRTNPAVFDSVPPGYCGIDVTLDDGPAFRTQLTFERGRVQALVVEPSDLSLGVGAPYPLPLVPFAGRLVVPSAWRRSSLTVSVERFDPKSRRFQVSSKLVAHAGTETSWYVDAGRVVAGWYQILVEECPWPVLCEVEPDGDYVWEVPEPTRVHVRCVVSGTGEHVPVEAVTWVPVAPSGYESGLEPRAAKAAAGGEIEFLAPAGEIILTVSHEGFETETRHASVAPGASDVVIPLTRLVD